MFMVQNKTYSHYLRKCGTFTAKEKQCQQQKKTTNASQPNRCLI